MPDRIFVDTNILVYFISDEKEKKLKAKELIFSARDVYISSQVIGEFISVCTTKELLDLDTITSLANNFMQALNFSLVDSVTINKALEIKKSSNYSYWDCLIVASALENNCSILYTEDLQDGETINNSLSIINPFK